jgi:hypothetical protein
MPGSNSRLHLLALFSGCSSRHFSGALPQQVHERRRTNSNQKLEDVWFELISSAVAATPNAIIVNAAVAL